MQALLAGEVDAKAWVAKNPKKHVSYIPGSNDGPPSGAGKLRNPEAPVVGNSSSGKPSPRLEKTQIVPSTSGSITLTPKGWATGGSENTAANIIKGTEIDKSVSPRGLGGKKASDAINSSTKPAFIQDPSIERASDNEAFGAISRAIVEDVQSFIDRKINEIENHNKNYTTDENLETARFQVFSQAFAKIINEFHIFRPILSGIKVEYDTHCHRLQERIRKNESAKKNHNIDEEKDKLLLSIETKKAYESEILHLKDEIKSLNNQLLLEEKNVKASQAKQLEMQIKFDQMVKENTETRQSMMSLSSALQRNENERKVLLERDHEQKQTIITMKINLARATDESEKMRAMLQESEELQSTLVSSDVLFKKEARNRFLETEILYYTELNKKIIHRYSILKSIIEGHAIENPENERPPGHAAHYHSALINPSSGLNERVGKEDIDFTAVQAKAIRVLKELEAHRALSQQGNSPKNDQIKPSSADQQNTMMSRRIIENLLDYIDELNKSVKEGILVDNFSNKLRNNIDLPSIPDEHFVKSIGNMSLQSDGAAWEDAKPATAAIELPDPHFTVPPLESPFRNFIGLGYSVVRNNPGIQIASAASSAAFASDQSLLPTILQTNGRVQNIFMSKRELLFELREIWFVRIYITMVAGKNEHGVINGHPKSRGNTVQTTHAIHSRLSIVTNMLNKANKNHLVKSAEAFYSETVKNMGFSDFVAAYLIFKYKSKATEMAYNLLYCLHNHSNVSDCFLFLLIYRGEVSEDLYIDVHRTSLRLFSGLKKVESDKAIVPCEICVKVSMRALASKADSVMQKCSKALTVDSKGDRSINYYELLQDDCNIFAEIINPEEANNDDNNGNDGGGGSGGPIKAEVVDMAMNVNHLKIVLKLPNDLGKDRSLFLEIYRYQLILDYVLFSKMLIEAISKLAPPAFPVGALLRMNSTVSNGSGSVASSQANSTAGQPGAETNPIPSEPSASLKAIRETISKIDPNKSRSEINLYLSCGSGLELDDVLLFEANEREVPIEPFVKRLKKALIKRSHPST